VHKPSTGAIAKHSLTNACQLADGIGVTAKEEATNKSTNKSIKKGNFTTPNERIFFPGTALALLRSRILTIIVIVFFIIFPVVVSAARLVQGSGVSQTLSLKPL
jgi:hypothetical protein